MAEDTLTNLQTRINLGKAETGPGKNTKTRVFQLMLDILDTVKGWLTKLNFDIDANEKRITNLPVAVGATEPVRKGEFDAQVLVTASKASTIQKTGKNKFNANALDVSLGYYVDFATGNLSASVSYNSTGFMPVTAGLAYTVSYKHKLCWYNSSKIFISGSSSTDLNKTQVAPSGAAFLRCTVALANWSTFQVEEGSLQTIFEAYRLYPELNPSIEIPISSIPTLVDTLNSKVSTIEMTGKNKFNINALDCSLSSFLVYSEGGVLANAAYNTTGFIPVTAGLSYTLSAKHKLCWYNLAKAFVAGSDSTDTNKTQTAPAGVSFLRCTVAIANWSAFQVEEGTAQTLFEAYVAYRALTDVKVEIADIVGLTDELAAVPTIIYSIGKNKFDKSKATIGMYLNSTGLPTSSNATYHTTDFIPVTTGDVICASGATAPLRFTAQYDAAKLFIPGTFSDTQPASILIATAKYIRISFYASGTDTYQVELGSNTAYEPFVAFKKLKDIKTIASDIYAINTVVDPAVSASLGFSKTNRISMPAKQYFFAGIENTIYHQAITERWLPDMYFVQLENSAFVNRSKFARLTNPVADASVDAKLYNLDFSVISTKNFALLVGAQATNNGALVINTIGDSLTYNSSYLFRARQLCPALSFSGLRVPYGDLGITVEGRGGWTLAVYFSQLHAINDSFSPFLHLADPYKYFGNTDFWKKVVTGNVGYEYSGFAAKATAIGFSAATGLKSAPAANDVMYNDVNARYERYDGAAWVVFATVVGDFTFNYGKYRSVWGIAQPNIVPVMLGTNDFRTQMPSGVAGVFATWKTQFEALVASVHADSPLAKIALLIPPTLTGAFNDSVDSPTFDRKMAAAMWNARKLMIDNFDNREAEKIYLVDTGSAIDPVYGMFLGASEKPFSDFAGTETVKLQGNNPHPSTEGYFQIGVRLAGFIQAVR